MVRRRAAYLARTAFRSGSVTALFGFNTKCRSPLARQSIAAREVWAEAIDLHHCIAVDIGFSMPNGRTAELTWPWRS